MADTLAKQAAQEEDEHIITYNRIPLTSAVNRNKEGGIIEMAEVVGKHGEGGAVQIILPFC
jgi:hypothetical protein